MPGPQDEAQTRDGSYTISIIGESTGKIFTGSENTLDIAGSFTVGEFNGLPTLTGNGTLTVGKWSFFPTADGHPHGILNGPQATVSSFSLEAGEVELDNHAEIVIGSVEGKIDLTVSGKLAMRSSTLRADFATIRCRSAEFGPDPASLGQIPVDLNEAVQVVNEQVIFNSTARLITSAVKAQTCILGSAARQQGSLILSASFGTFFRACHHR